MVYVDSIKTLLSAVYDALAAEEAGSLSYIKKIFQGVFGRGLDIFPCIIVGGDMTNDIEPLTIGAVGLGGRGGEDQHTVSGKVRIAAQNLNPQLAYIGDDDTIKGVVDMANDVEQIIGNLKPSGFDYPIRITRVSTGEAETGGGMIVYAEIDIQTIFHKRRIL